MVLAAGHDPRERRRALAPSALHRLSSAPPCNRIDLERRGGVVSARARGPSLFPSFAFR
jgi:hypothetical protein